MITIVLDKDNNNYNSNPYKIFFLARGSLLTRIIYYVVWIHMDTMQTYFWVYIIKSPMIMVSLMYTSWIIKSLNIIIIYSSTPAQ